MLDEPPLRALRRLAKAMDNAAVRRVSEHEKRKHPETEDPPKILAPRVVAEIIAWMGAQWADTWSFDYEAASVRFDIPVEVLRSEVTSFLRARAGYGPVRQG